MSWPSYPEHDYRRRKKFGVYFDPRDDALNWGLRVHGVGSFTSKSHDIPPTGRVMDVFALVIVREGKGFLSNKDGVKSVMKAGDVLAVVPDWWHLYNPDEKTGWTTAWVIFDGPVAETLHASGELLPGLLATGVGDAGLKALGAIFDGMFGLSMGRTDTPQLQARLAGELLGLIARISDWRGQQLASGCNPELSDAIKYVEEHYPEEIDFDALLEKTGMSSTHFRRQFKRATGDGPQTYQQRLRVRLAKELLRHSSLSVAEVGARVGYDKAAYFSRVFNSRVGMAPTAWRRSGL